MNLLALLNRSLFQVFGVSLLELLTPTLSPDGAGLFALLNPALFPTGEFLLAPLNPTLFQVYVPQPVQLNPTLVPGGRVLARCWA